MTELTREQVKGLLAGNYVCDVGFIDDPLMSRRLARALLSAWAERDVDTAHGIMAADLLVAALDREAKLRDVADAAKAQHDYMMLCGDLGDLERNLGHALRLAGYALTPIPKLSIATP